MFVCLSDFKGIIMFMNNESSFLLSYDIYTKGMLLHPFDIFI